MPTEIDIAAGGLLETGAGSNLKLAIIFRPRYSDWTLPKGHLDPGETVDEAALREVREETGCTGEIVELVQPTAYLVRGQPKIVVFFRMKAVERPEFVPNDEASELRWVSPPEALSELSYRTEKQVVASAYSL